MDRIRGVCGLAIDNLGRRNATFVGCGGEVTGEVDGDYLKPGTLVGPGPRGRILRLLVGGLQVTTIVLALLHTNIFLRPEEPFSVSLFVVIWLGFSLVVDIRFLGDMVNTGFRVSWGNRPYWVLLGLAALTLALSLGFSGAIWALPFSLFVFAVILYTAAHLGISHILAAILGTPGCEMRSIPQLVAILRRSDFVEEHSCPGLWDHYDKREARRPSA